MMYCERCNIDFPEGLRYCKWCGQTLIERRRNTSELHFCPNCSAAVQPRWAFCKVCGVRLASAPREALVVACPQCGTPANPGALHCLNCGHHLQAGSEAPPSEVPSTAIIALCPTCGERIDPGSVYCKGCGAALYEQPTPFGQSAIICAACQSFNPVGSTTCRVCSASLIVTAGAMADQTVTRVVSEKNSDTLPDLADHLSAHPSGEFRQPTGEHASPPPQTLEHGTPPASLSDSGAYTLAFDAERTAAIQAPGTEGFQDHATSAVQSSLPTVQSHPKGGDTSVLPGVAGSRFEQPQPTASLNMGRDTGPVEEEVEASDEAPAAGELSAPPATELSRPAAPDVRQNTDELAAQSSAPPALHETFTFASDVDATPPAGTVALGADSAPPVGFNHQPEPEPLAAPDEAAQAMGGVAPTETIHEAAPDFERLPQATLPIEQAAPPVLAQSNVHYPVTAAPAAPVMPASPKKGRAGLFAGIFITLFVIGIAFGAWWFMFARKSAAPLVPTNPTETPSMPAPPTETPKPSAPVAPEGMVLVAAGSYRVGRDDASDVEKPQHTVTLPAYFIDRTEVTNEAYKQFVDATNHKPPTNWSGNNFPTGRASYPVTGITWQDAADYATWAGKRLPTEAEWEAAARGTEGRRYTWGDEWLPGQANIGVQAGQQAKDDDYPPQIMAVGGFPQSASPVGALDMIGNAWEWTADEFKFYAGNPASLDDPQIKADLKLKPGITYRVIRGGAFDGGEPHDSSYRGWIDAGRAYPKTGFRCVKDVK